MILTTDSQWIFLNLNPKLSQNRNMGISSECVFLNDNTISNAKFQTDST